MNPWVIAALIAGVIGLATMANASAAAGLNAIPKVTAFGIVDVPTPGLNGQWDLWVTGINGLSGNDMTAMTPGHQRVYIPAAIVQAQPLNVDFRYNFTPVGSATPWTILVPASILQAYAALPKTDLYARIMSGELANLNMQGRGITMVQFGTCGPAQIQKAISDAKNLISTFPSDSGQVLTWLGNNAGSIITLIGEVQTAVACATNSSDQQNLNTLLGVLQSYASKGVAAGVGALVSAGSSLFNTPSAGSATDGASDSPTDSPTDSPPTDSPTDSPPTDSPTDSA